MKFFKRKTDIQSIISLSFTLLILLVLMTISVAFSLVHYQTNKKVSISNLEYSCKSIGENIDLQAQQLDTILLNTINSQELKSTIKDFAAAETEDRASISQLRRHLASLLISFKGFDYAVRQLSIYSIEGAGYGVGDKTGALPDPKNLDWYKTTYDLAGRRYFKLPSSDKKGCIAIYRAYYDEYHRIAGFIEGKKYYSDFFSSALKPNLSYDPTVVIYDSNNDIVFPLSYTASEEFFPYYDYKSDVTRKIYNTTSKSYEYVTYYKLKNIDFTVAMAVNTNVFMIPVFTSLLGIFLIFLVILILGLMLANYMSLKISAPIRTIYHFLYDTPSFDLEKDHVSSERLKMSPTNIIEIDKLIASINEYIEQSEKQTREIITLNEQEIQAQMLALQSQMNPHFLYNSLASISEMSRQGMTDSVTKMTVNISQILRYISSNRDQVTTVEEELELCDMYLECMKLRFGNDLTYSFEVEDDLLDMMIPKLCIQLLVENAIKSVTKQAPPWTINVIGYIKDDCWYIEVQDNGPGFSPDIDKKLRSQMDSILETKTLPSLKIEGMGILNIFIRFYLLDGITFLFDFGNREDGGAFVKVGRHITKKEV